MKRCKHKDAIELDGSQKWCPDCGSARIDTVSGTVTKWHQPRDKFWDEFRPSWRPKRLSVNRRTH